MATFSTKWFDARTKQEITDPDELMGHDAYCQAVCDEDGSRVRISAVGTAEYARCRKGHRWQQTFNGRADSWIEQ